MNALKEKEKSENEYKFFKEQYDGAYNYMDFILKSFKKLVIHSDILNLNMFIY